MTGFLEVEELRENYRLCRIYTKHFAKTFYFASHVLPKQKRQSAYALYAFCRYADEIVDHRMSMSSVVQARQRIESLKNQVRYVYAHSHLMDPKLRAFRDTVFQYDIPQEYFMDLLRGVEMDLTKNSYRNFAELNDYCYCVASVVGLMMTRIFGAEGHEALRHAKDLGTAMQLTNILRDVGEDFRRGRVYLPKDELDSFGCSEDDLRGGIISDRFVALMQFQIKRAREYYESAGRGIPMLTGERSRYCVRLMSRTYSKILDAIESNGYDVFTRRAYAAAPDKLFIALTSLGNTSGVSAERENRRVLHSSIPAGQHS